MKVFKNLKEFNDFFNKIRTNWIENKIEYKVFSGYEENKILIVAPHAFQGRCFVNISGKMKKIKVGETNIHILTKIASYNINGAFIISYVPRTEADFARKPELLGKGLKLNFLVNGKRHPIDIHKNTKYFYLLEKFHKMIEDLNPKFILSFHGTEIPNFDALLGFGKNKKYIKGKENAFRFRKNVLKKLKKLDIQDLKIKISKIYRGISEAVLNMHVKDNRMGILVEFNKTGRLPFPSLKYQKMAICIAETAAECVL